MQPSIDLSAFLTTLDSSLTRGQRRLRRALRRFEAVRVVPFRGYLAPAKAVVLARTLESDQAVEARLQGAPRLLRVAYERFGTLERGGVPVRVVWQSQARDCRSDAAGFVDQSFVIAAGQPPAATTVAELSVSAGPMTEVARAEVLTFAPNPSLGVISDIDDTVLETELSNPYKRALQLIYSEQRMRLPFEGIAALYQAFALGGNPIFYVSNAPWNLYQHVTELLDHHDIPKGPLLLRDVGLAERVPRSAPPLGRFHKQRALQRIVADFPKLAFVLLGDSSRRDPVRYVELAERFPGRVATIYIRRVMGRLARRDDLSLLQQRAARAGVELVVADDTVSIAQHAESRGLVKRGEAAHVQEGKREDEQSPPTELGSVLSSTGTG
jgi:phosphatidate phosphatase APP1